MDRENSYYKNFNKIFISMLTLIASCAPDSSRFVEYYGNFANTKEFEVVKIFFIKDKEYKMNCDVSGNQLLMKFSKKENKWKRSKYISKGCNFNSAKLY